MTSPNSNGQFQAREIARWWSRNKVLAVNLSRRRLHADTVQFTWHAEVTSSGTARIFSSAKLGMRPYVSRAKDEESEREKKGKIGKITAYTFPC